MNNQPSQFQLNVGFIAQQGIGYRRDFQFGFPTIHFQPDIILHDFTGRIEVSRTSEGLLSQSKFQASIDATCSRCLADFQQILKTEFTELFTFETHALEDTELIYPNDGQIDFGPIAREYFLLELPINPLCKVDCKGLCLICGNNINIKACDHGEETGDSRLAILKTLLDDD
jgi:uncharacterized protein